MAAARMRSPESPSAFALPAIAWDRALHRAVLEPDHVADLRRGRDDGHVGRMVEEDRLGRCRPHQQARQVPEVVPDHVVAGQPGQVGRHRHVDRIQTGGAERHPHPVEPGGVLLRGKGLRPVDLVAQVVLHGSDPPRRTCSPRDRITKPGRGKPFLPPRAASSGRARQRSSRAGPRAGASASCAPPARFRSRYRRRLWNMTLIWPRIRECSRDFYNPAVETR